MSEISLAEVIRGLRAEFEAAMLEGRDASLAFEAKQLELEFQVGVTKAADAKGGIKFLVFELGSGGSYSNETIQRVKVSLEPRLASGESVKIAARKRASPLASKQ